MGCVSGKQVATLTGGGPVSFSPNGGLLASASAVKIRWVPHGDGGAGGESSGGQEIKLWDVSTGESIATLLLSDITFGYPTNMMVFSPDGRLLASSTHRTVALWDVSEWMPTPHKLTSSSGDGQQGRAGTKLAEPFVVSVLDQYGVGPFWGGSSPFPSLPAEGRCLLPPPPPMPRAAPEAH